MDLAHSLPRFDDCWCLDRWSGLGLDRDPGDSGSLAASRQSHMFPTRIGSSHAIHPHTSRGGCGIFIYRNNRWELESDLSAPGYEPSPPTVEGAYEGQVVKKESWPKIGP